MKRLISFVLTFCVMFVSASAQKAASVEITAKQWNELFAALGNEEWDTAFDLSDKYLKLLKNDDAADDVPNLRYMYLFSAAGRVAEKKMSYDELEKTLKMFVGKKIVFPFRTITDKCSGREFNFICPSNEAKNKVSTAATNRQATSIFAFEYTALKEDFDTAKHKGKVAAIGGIVESIVPNPNKSTLVILRIYVSDGYIIFREKKKSSEQ